MENTDKETTANKSNQPWLLMIEALEKIINTIPIQGFHIQHINHESMRKAYSAMALLNTISIIAWPKELLIETQEKLEQLKESFDEKDLANCLDKKKNTVINLFDRAILTLQTHSGKPYHEAIEEIVEINLRTLKNTYDDDVRDYISEGIVEILDLLKESITKNPPVDNTLRLLGYWKNNVCNSPVYLTETDSILKIENKIKEILNVFGEDVDKLLDFVVELHK